MLLILTIINTTSILWRSQPRGSEPRLALGNGFKIDKSVIVMSGIPRGIGIGQGLCIDRKDTTRATNVSGILTSSST